MTMQPRIWQAGAAPAGFDLRRTLGAFLYDSARQADYWLRNLGVHVLPDEGLARYIDSSSSAWLIPTLVGADGVEQAGDGTATYGGMEVLWTVYSVDSGAPGTGVGDFPAAHHAEVVAAVIAVFLGTAVFAVDGATGRIAEPHVLRGIYEGVNHFSRVESDQGGYLQSVVSTAAVAYVADERSVDIRDSDVLRPVDYVELGLMDRAAGGLRFRYYDVARREWRDGKPD